MTRYSIWVFIIIFLSACSISNPDSPLLEFIEVPFQEGEETTATEGGVTLHLNGIYAIDKDIVFTYGYLNGGHFGRSTLLRSDNSGQNWQEVLT